MPTLEIVLPKPHAAQQHVIDTSKRFNVVNCGRRFGKTMLGLNRCVDPTILHYPIGWFSPTYKMLLEVWREAAIIFHPIEKRKNAQERRIEFITGGLIEFWSLDDINAGRGRKYKRIIVDEAAMVKKLMDHWDIVLRSTLADYQGDAWFLSTPKGRNGFWQLYERGQAENHPEWASWQMPTESNPFIIKSEVAAMKASMPELVYNQEVLAQFLEDAGGVFRNVTAAATAKEQERMIQGHEYVIGVDWGKLNDFTAIIVIDATINEAVYVDRFSQIDYQIQLGRLMTVCRRFQPYAVLAERNSIGEPLIEQLVGMGVPVQPFTTTSSSKMNIINALSLAFERGDLAIVPDVDLISELQAYEAERLPGGAIRYGAPYGMHDDTVMSLAIAWHGINAAQETYRPLTEPANISRW